MAGTRNKAKLDEVRDEQGRRRFHGAFTGGFSAGYYNSVGTEEGWQPRTWQSSRGSRGSAAQRPEDFMDEEDGLLGRELEAQLPYDTLGEQARRMVREEAGRQVTGAAIPGIEAVDELLAPTCVAIGKKLLQLMGWKEGQGVGSRQTRKRRRQEGDGGEAEAEGEGEEMDDAEFLPEHLRAQAVERGLVQQGRIAFARRDVESFTLPVPKDDLYGLGFDPDKHAPEFAALREAARARDDRGVYRMGDVTGQASSSRAGFRDATGFALDDSEDDVYDADAPLAMVRKKEGASCYDTVLRDEEVDEEEEGPGAARRGRDAGAAHRMALEEWIGGAGDAGAGGSSSSTTKRAPARCPTDSRPVPEGFVLGVAQWAFKQAFWPPPTPPRSFVPFHRFEDEGQQADHAAAVAGQRDANRGRLVASARGSLLGEVKPELPPGKGSVFDLMSEADRGRLLGKAQAVAGGATAAEALPPPPPMAQAGGVPVFQGMQGALAKRFSVVEAPKPTTLQEGLIEVGKGGGIAPSVGATAARPPRTKPLREPTRSQELWHPTSLLCRRFGVPVPQHAKLTPAAAVGGGGQQRVGGAGGGGHALAAAAPPASSLLSNKFDQEMAALLPGGNLLAQQEAAAAAAEEDEEQPEAAAEEAALPSFDAKPRPAKDFFKAIFEASDSEDEDDEDSDEKEAEETGGKAVAVKTKVEEPKLAGDAPTPPRQPAAAAAAAAAAASKGKEDGSPPRDHFLQPAAAAEGESIEEILARGPVLIPRKKRLAAPAARGGSDGEGRDGEEEEEEGLVFGAAVIKKPKKKRLKPTTAAAPAAPPVAVAGPGATPPRLAGGDATPPPGSTLLMAQASAGLPPTPPPRAATAADDGEEAASMAVSSFLAAAAAPASSAAAPAQAPVPVKQEEGGDGDGGGGGGSSSSSGDDEGDSEEEGGKKERSSSRSHRHKKEKKHRKESRKDSKKKRKHKKEERQRRDDDSGDERRDRKKSRHHDRRR